ncbi:MAG: biotin/lipoate A/B protein ligase family protein [Halobacteriaceae archaeon]
MRVLRGRAETREADGAVTGELLETAAETEEVGLRVWRPHRQLAFGRRDTRRNGYERARLAAEERGFPPIVRRVGGRACAYTGRTVAFVRAEPVADARSGLTERYEAVSEAVQRACWRLGVPAQRGEPPNAFCPGGHSLSADGKLVGIAQRVTGGAAMVAGTLIVEDHEAIGGVLEPVYDALDLDLDPATVSSLSKAGGRTEWPTIRATLEDALVGEATPRVEQVHAGASEANPDG